MGGGNHRRAANSQATQRKRERTESQEARGQQNKQHKAPRPRAPWARNERKQEKKGAQRNKKRRSGKKKTKQKRRRRENKGPRPGLPQPGGGQARQKDKAAKRKGEAHQNAPGRLARPTRPGYTSTGTHARDQGVASPYPQWEVSASTQNSPGAPAESPVERQTVQETGRVSDRVHTRQPPQRTQPKTDAGGTRQGQPHRGAPNGYDSARAQSPCLGGGQRQAQSARLSAGLRVPRAATQ